jgi:hypothetical protein
VSAARYVRPNRAARKPAPALDPAAADELAARREAASQSSEPASTTDPEGSRKYRCDAGCGRQVSRATRTRHRRDGCPVAA